MFDLNDRGEFLNLAALCEGGLVVAAIGLGWLVGVKPLEDLLWNWKGVAWGAAAAVPMVLFFLLFYRFPFGPLLKIRQILLEMLGPPLSACRWYDLILLAAVVGFCEEILFRGVLQPWFERLWGPAYALAGSNILFGLAHCITPLYAVLAGVTGCYLGWLLDGTGERNLLIPVVTHAIYDYLAFLVVIYAYRRKPEENLPEVEDST